MYSNCGAFVQTETRKIHKVRRKAINSEAYVAIYPDTIHVGGPTVTELRASAL